MKSVAVLKGVLSIIKDGARWAVNYRYRAACAQSPCHDDLYVVSFPKSGATWMDFLMANVHLQMSGDRRHVTFFNVHNFVPDIHFSRDIRQALAFPGFRVAKSHSPVNPYYKNIIYIVRDPRDVLVSYYHFLLGLGNFSGDIKALIRSETYGISAWSEHVRGWMEDTSAATRFIYIRYEDLKADPLQTLKKIYGFMGYDLDDSVLQSAVEKSSFENMKYLEAEYGYGGRDIGARFEFMRKGKSGGWKEELDSEDIALVKQTAGKWMEKFGYNNA